MADGSVMAVAETVVDEVESPARHAGQPESCLGEAHPLQWLGEHAHLTGAGVTLVFGDGSAARIDGVLPEAEGFGAIVARLRAVTG
jgi:hypothetical protein